MVFARDIALYYKSSSGSRVCRANLNLHKFVVINSNKRVYDWKKYKTIKINCRHFILIQSRWLYTTLYLLLLYLDGNILMVHFKSRWIDWFAIVCISHRSLWIGNRLLAVKFNQVKFSLRNTLFVPSFFRCSPNY